MIESFQAGVDWVCPSDLSSLPLPVAEGSSIVVYNGAVEVGGERRTRRQYRTSECHGGQNHHHQYCGSDLHTYEGRTDPEPGRVIGQENPGEVAAIGGGVKPSVIVSLELPLAEAPEGYRHFDHHREGWTKVVLKPAA